MGKYWPLFVYFHSFLLQKTIVVFIGIQTGNVKVEGNHADHLTITTSTAFSNSLTEINSRVLNRIDDRSYDWQAREISSLDFDLPAH